MIRLISSPYHLGHRDVAIGAGPTAFLDGGAAQQLRHERNRMADQGFALNARAVLAGRVQDTDQSCARTRFARIGSNYGYQLAAGKESRRLLCFYR